MRALLYGKERQIRDLLEQTMLARGHIVHVRADAHEAAEMIRMDCPPLVVLGHVEEDTLDLCRQVRASDKKDVVSVLFVVSEEAHIHLPAVVEAGADDYAITPLEPKRLNARLDFAERKATDKALRKRYERELEGRIRQQAAVSELGRQALAGVSVQEMMDFAVQAVAGALGVEFCKVLERIPGTDKMMIRAGVGWMEGVVGASTVELTDATQAGYTFLGDEPVVVDNLRTETRFREPRILLNHGIVSGMSVVIAGEMGVYGVLSAHTSNRHAFSKDDVHFLQSVANVLAAVIDRTRTEDALRESEARANAILQTTPDGIVTIDEKGIIESFNPSAEEIFGWHAHEVIGRNVALLMPPPFSEEHDVYIQRFLDTGVPHIIGNGRETVAKHRDGHTFPVDLAVSEVCFVGRRIFTAILRDITERRKLEQEILEISEQERRRIGQDLHDGLGQMLTGIGLISRNLTRRLEGGGKVTDKEVREVYELIKEADQYARGLARGLVPVELDEGGLSAALSRLALHARRLFGIRCSLEESGTPTFQNNTVATHLYRIAQEALSNAVKHGRAGQVNFSLASGTDKVRLRILDDGVGFPHILEDSRGMGVRIMHHRARMIGATLDIRALPEGGTLVTCTLPRRNERYPTPLQAGYTDER